MDCETPTAVRNPAAFEIALAGDTVEAPDVLLVVTKVDGGATRVEEYRETFVDLGGQPVLVDDVFPDGGRYEVHVERTDRADVAVSETVEVPSGPRDDWRLDVLVGEQITIEQYDGDALSTATPCPVP